ncbi:hypothetical protein AOLI_G00114170 [Acnodon oligacanthus]
MADKTRQSVPVEDSICALCEDYLTVPVILRCCHRLCKSCLHCYWELTGSLRCPVCLREPSCEVLLHSLGSKPGSDGAEAAGSELLEVKNTGSKKQTQPKLGLPRAVSTVASAGSEKSGTTNRMWMKIKYGPIDQKKTATFSLEETITCGFKPVIEQSRRNKLKDDQQLVNTEICSRNQRPDSIDELTSSKVARSPKVAQTSLNAQSPVTTLGKEKIALGPHITGDPVMGTSDEPERPLCYQHQIDSGPPPRDSEERAAHGAHYSKSLGSKPGSDGAEAAGSDLLEVKNTGSKKAQPKMALPRAVSSVASAGSEKSGTANQMWMEIKYEPIDQKITATFSLEETITCGFKPEIEQSRRNKLKDDEQLVNTEICSHNRTPDSTDQLTSSKFSRSAKGAQTSLNAQSPVTEFRTDLPFVLLTCYHLIMDLDIVTSPLQ